MKIILFDYVFEKNQPGTTGFSDMVWSWAKELVKFKEEVHIVSPEYIGVKPPDGVITHFFKVPPMGYRNIIGHILISIFGWWEILKIKGEKIIHAPEYLSTSVFSLLDKRSRIIMTTPGNIFERINNVNHADKITTSVLRFSARISAKNCYKIIATSGEMRDWWIYSGSLPDKVVTIPLGVDIDKFRPISNGKDILGLNNKFSVLFVGRLQGENGCDILIKAFYKFHQFYPESILDIVGDGTDKQKLIDLAFKLEIGNAIRWHGIVPFERLPLFYSACDVFVLPRFSKVTPRVLFEAMACQKIVISSNIGGIDDFITNGQNGFLINPENLEEISEKLSWIVNNQNESSEIAEKAREFVLENVGWTKIVNRIRNEVYFS